MSSFENSHRMYLFAMKNGRKKLAYGRNPGDALEILRSRLSEEEMAAVIPESHERISQRELQAHVRELG